MCVGEVFLSALCASLTIPSVLSSLRKRLSLFNRAAPAQPSSGSDLRDAIVTLLFVVVLSDDKILAEEERLIRKVLTNHFSVPDDEVDSCLAELRQRATDSISQHKELKLILDNCAVEERVNIINMCWDLAYADGELSPDEEHIIRRIAQILHLSNADYIRAKLSRQQAATTADAPKDIHSAPKQD